MDFINTWWVGIVFIISGLMRKRTYPEKISAKVGYRTKRSKSSQEAWIFANELSVKMYIISGVIAIIAANLLNYFVTKNIYSLLSISILICFIGQVITEFVLKRTFDKNGVRKK